MAVFSDEFRPRLQPGLDHAERDQEEENGRRAKERAGAFYEKEAFMTYL